MLAWDYYIIKESKNKFKDWTQAGLEHLRKQYKNLQDEKERKRIKKILDDLNKRKWFFIILLLMKIYYTFLIYKSIAY